MTEKEVKLIDLKPCPFCGGEAQMKVEKHSPSGFDYTPRCSVPSCAGRLSKKWTSKETAIYAWNKRVVSGSERSKAD